MLTVETCQLNLILPSKYKIVKIKPFFRKGIKTEAKNYTPISLLTLISKVIENSTNNQAQGYLQRDELLHIYQLGLRANHSTCKSLSWLTDMILNGAKNGKHTGIILIDLQNAFDTFDHKILLDKLHRFYRWNNKMVSFSPHTQGFFSVLLDNIFSEAGTIN